MFKTQAVKLPYLVDVIAKNTLGHLIADGTYQAWEHGVVTKEVYSFVERAISGDELFSVEKHDYSESGKRISLATKKPSYNDLTLDELAVIDTVADLYGEVPPEDLGYLTKQINTQIHPDSWGKNGTASVGEEAFFRLGAGWQSLCSRISVEDLDDRSQWSAPINDDPMAHFLRAVNG
jgi:uncharacterized phage-associated protein